MDPNEMPARDAEGRCPDTRLSDHNTRTYTCQAEALLHVVTGSTQATCQLVSGDQRAEIFGLDMIPHVDYVLQPYTDMTVFTPCKGTRLQLQGPLCLERFENPDGMLMAYCINDVLTNQRNRVVQQLHGNTDFWETTAETYKGFTQEKTPDVGACLEYLKSRFALKAPVHRQPYEDHSSSTGQCCVSPPPPRVLIVGGSPIANFALAQTLSCLALRAKYTPTFVQLDLHGTSASQLDVFRFLPSTIGAVTLPEVTSLGPKARGALGDDHELMGRVADGFVRFQPPTQSLGPLGRACFFLGGDTTTPDVMLGASVYQRYIHVLGAVVTMHTLGTLEEMLQNLIAQTSVPDYANSNNCKDPTSIRQLASGLVINGPTVSATNDVSLSHIDAIIQAFHVTTIIVVNQPQLHTALSQRLKSSLLHNVPQTFSWTEIHRNDLQHHDHQLPVLHSPPISFDVLEQSRTETATSACLWNEYFFNSRTTEIEEKNAITSRLEPLTLSVVYSALRFVSVSNMSGAPSAVSLKHQIFAFVVASENECLTTPITGFLYVKDVVEDGGGVGEPKVMLYVPFIPELQNVSDVRVAQYFSKEAILLHGANPFYLYPDGTL